MWCSHWSNQREHTHIKRFGHNTLSKIQKLCLKWADDCPLFDMGESVIIFQVLYISWYDSQQTFSVPISLQNYPSNTLTLEYEHILPVSLLNFRFMWVKLSPLSRLVLALMPSLLHLFSGSQVSLFRGWFSSFCNFSGWWTLGSQRILALGR